MIALLHRSLRLILAADTALGVLVFPLVLILVAGLARSGQILPAAAVAGAFAATGFVYGRYWRRYPLR